MKYLRVQFDFALEMWVSIYHTHLNCKFLLIERNLGLFPFSNALAVEPQPRMTLLSKRTPEKSETNVEILRNLYQGCVQ